MNYRLNPLVQHNMNDNYGHSVLKARGVEDVDKYLSADENCEYSYHLLDNIIPLAQAIIDGMRNDKIFFIQVDSDNDGITSAAIIYNYLKMIDNDIRIDYRMHTGKQHGVIPSTVPDDVDIVIIPDAGSNQYSEHQELKERGIEVLVIDHHEAPSYSEAALVVNNQLSVNYPNKSLSGAGVVYKVCEALDDLLGVTHAQKFLDLAAVGIVGDMMELKDLETRFIVSYGLSHITNFGLNTIIEKMAYSIGDIDNITPTAVSFYITPLLNAIIRVGTEDEKDALFLAFIDGARPVPSTKRGAKEGELEIAAEKAARVGTNAKNRQKKIVDEGIEILNQKIKKNDLDLNKVIIVTLDDFEAKKIDSTLTGLVAMKLTAQYKKPTLIVREADDGIYKGSARGDNNSEVSEFKDFISSSNLFEFAEGHQGAFGVGIDPNNIDRFIDYCNTELADIDLAASMYMVDYEFDESNLQEAKRAAFDIDPLKTVWGKSVEEPRIALKNIRFTIDQVSIMGKTHDTIKISVGGISLMKFKSLDFAEEITKYDFGCITLVGRFQLNEWMGTVTPQIIIEDYILADDRATF